MIAKILRVLRERRLHAPAWFFRELCKRLRRVVMYGRAWVHRRHSAHVTYIGITGTAGKTTTKDLSAAILSAFAPCQSSDRSENEPFYVAQTIACVGPQHRFCIAEVAAFGKSTVDLPARLLSPDIAVLTLIAREHYSAFRSLEAIAAEKAKLIAALRPQGVAVLNIDDPLVRSIGERCNRRVIWIGQGEGATLRLRSAASLWPGSLRLVVEHEGKTHHVRTRLHGTQLALAALAALGVALAAGFPLEKAIAALAAAEPAEGRMQIVTRDDGVVFIRDDWKAAHWSMQPPLDFLKAAQAPRKVVVVGSVSDSPRGPSRRYPRLARLALEVADVVVFVCLDTLSALNAVPAGKSKSLRAFARLQDAANYLATELRAGDLVLVKGINTQDHLVRLVLNRSRQVQCWRERCGLSRFCGRCKKLYEPVPASREMPFSGLVH